MYAPGDYLERLNMSPRYTTEYYALAADFKPQAQSLLARFGWKVADAAIADRQRKVFDQADGVHHCSYFGAAVARQQVLRWLG